MKLNNLLNEYYSSFDFNTLRSETKAQYQYFLSVSLTTDVKTLKHLTVLGDIDFSKVTTKIAKLCYEKWCEKGIHMANHVLSVTRILFNYAIHMEYCEINPFSNIKRRTPEARKVVWAKEDVKKFLDVSYSEFKYRSIGLIVHMAYEWCQRLGDMRTLTWESLDLENKKAHITQSKRRAEVFLPISDDLNDMLKTQQEDFGFQKYVAPRPKPIRGLYEAYSLTKLPFIGRQVMNLAGISTNLRLSDLRRTGTTEMVDAGVSMGNIMSVTGHANPQSVKPYMKNTFTSASLALNKRKNLTD